METTGELVAYFSNVISMLTVAHLDTSRNDREALQNKMINEEYKIWKKNSVFLYDVMYS